jgi:hypothetical protein
VFQTHDREAFFEAIKTMRDACIEVLRKSRYGSLDYRTADELKKRLDDAVGALTGNRQALWIQPHGGPEPDVIPRVKPVTPDD